MTERELIYEIYGLIEDNQSGQKSRPHLYWLIGTTINKYAAEHPMQKDITGAVANLLEEAIRTGVGFSARNLRYMRKFAQTMSHPDQWDDAVRARRWMDHVKTMVRTKGASKGERETKESPTPVRDQPSTVRPKRHPPGVTVQVAPETESHQARLTDTHIVTLTSAVLGRIPGVSLTRLNRHVGRRNLLEAVSLHVVSPASETDVVLVIHSSHFKAIHIESIYRVVTREFPWRTITFVQYNIDTRMHSAPDSNDLKLHHLIKRLLIEVRRVFRAVKP
ncbi:DUF1016 N-terminal domain-containing protein [Deinococcus sp. PEB2-63]